MAALRVSHVIPSPPCANTWACGHREGSSYFPILTRLSVTQRLTKPIPGMMTMDPHKPTRILVSGGHTACTIHRLPPPGHSIHQKPSIPDSSEKHLTGLRHRALPVFIVFSSASQSHADGAGPPYNHRLHPEPTLISPETPDYFYSYFQLSPLDSFAVA